MYSRAVWYGGATMNCRAVHCLSHRVPIARARGLIALLCVLMWAMVAGPLPSASAAGQRVVELPVAFQVINSNTSQDPCLSDGSRYTIRGHITGPESAFRGSPTSPITMYLYGYEGGEWNWDL